ncbi:Hypothetical predicted protein, partial [Marmota monax]
NRAARQRKNRAAFELQGLALNFDTLMVSRILDDILSYNVLLRHGNGIKNIRSLMPATCTGRCWGNRYLLFDCSSAGSGRVCRGDE